MTRVCTQSVSFLNHYQLDKKFHPNCNLPVFFIHSFCFFFTFYYMFEPCLNSHIDFTNNLSSTYNIDIGKYGRNVVGLNSTPPYMRCSPNVSISPLLLYPLAKDDTLNIYTDGSKTPNSTGCAFVVFLIG